MTEFDKAYETCARELAREFDTPAPSKETVLANLPDWLKEEANEWGWTDTCVRDQLFEFMVEL